MDNESINFAIDVANSVLFQIAADNNCNKVVRYGHKKRTVKFYEGRKLILLVQIIRCTVIHEDQTEEHHYHELLPDILLPFLQYTAASFAILKYSSDKAANMAEQDKPIWCRLITTEQWSVYMDLIADCSPSKVAYLSCEDSEQRLANRSSMLSNETVKGAENLALMYSFYQSCKLHGVNFEEYMKKVLAVMTMNMDKIIFEKNKNGTITCFKSHTISNEVLDELMPWNENFKK